MDIYIYYTVHVYVSSLLSLATTYIGINKSVYALENLESNKKRKKETNKSTEIRLLASK